MNPDLPQGWTEVVFNDLLTELRNGISTRPNIDPPGTQILRISAARSGSVDLDDCRFLPEADSAMEAYRLRDGDLLFTRYNGSIDLLGVCGMVRRLGNRRLLYPDKLMRARVDDKITLPGYVEVYFQSARAREAITAMAKSSAGQQGVSGSNLKAQCVPLPPLAEQRRIVAKVEELLAQVNAAKYRLAKVPAILKQFRQSVLAAACSGRLTENWPKHEESWPLVALGDLVQDGPQNGLYKPQSAYGSGVPIVRIDDFRGGVLRPWNELKCLQVEDAELAKFGIREGDLLVNRVNSIKFLGKSVLVPAGGPPAVFESNMMKCSLDRSRLAPHYALLFLSSPDGSQELRKNAKHAVNQASINQDDVRAVEIPLPSVDEQLEIIRRANALLALADSADKRVAASSEAVACLTQAILAKAFRGVLVPTEAELALAEGRNYETAEQLLTRVRGVDTSNEMDVARPTNKRARSAEPARARKRA